MVVVFEISRTKLYKGGGVDRTARPEFVLNCFPQKCEITSLPLDVKVCVACLVIRWIYLLSS